MTGPEHLRTVCLIDQDQVSQFDNAAFDALEFIPATGQQHQHTNDDRRKTMADASWEAGRRLPDWPDSAAIVAGVLKAVAAGGDLGDNRSERA